MGVMVILGAITFERQASEVCLGRRYVRGLLKAEGRASENAVLVASELLTNAVDHGAGPNMSLFLATDETSVYVEVADAGSTTTPALQSPDASSEHGRGLTIVASLALSWGTTRTPGRTTVWATLNPTD